MIWQPWRSRKQGWMTAIVLTLLSGLPAIAQSDVLNDARITRLENNVELRLRDQTPRAARLQDVLVPRDALRTANASIAELLFNEGSLARVDQNSNFYFDVGLRRYQLPNLIAMNETIFVLESGTALIISPPNSVGTRVETPDSQINIVATGETATIPTQPRLALPALDHIPHTVSIASKSEISPTLLGQTSSDPPSLLPAPERSSVVLVHYSPEARTTQVFALTDGDITVASQSGGDSVSLLGGQMVSVTPGQVGEVMEFDLEGFYDSVPLAAGLGPGQEDTVAQQPPAVQASLNAVRGETLEAVENQEDRLAGFRYTFLQDALSGSDTDFDGQRGESRFVIIGNPISGVFVVTDDDDDDGVVSARFEPDDPAQPDRQIVVDTNDRSASINGDSGIDSSGGLSGADARATILFSNGRATRIEVFDVGGEEPRAGDRFQGRLTEGAILPDR